MLRTRAAVFDGERLTVVDDVVVRAPAAGEVRVRVLASGVCHSDLNVLDGTSPVPPPVVLGHEAAGVVESVGAGVDGVAPGDEVAVATAVACGRCRACATDRRGECTHAFAPNTAPFTWRGKAVRAYANVASFAGMTVVRAEQVVKASGLPTVAASLIGCAVSTGYGVAANVVPVRAGDTVVVFGVGGIGVNVLQTARLLDAATVVAVDVNPEKSAVARHFGAHEVVIAPPGTTSDDLVAQVRAAAAAPIDVAVECSGAPTAITAAVAAIGPGGTTALVGIPPLGAVAPVDVNALLRNRRVVGSLNGLVDVPRDFPVIVDHARRGVLDLDAQVSRVWPLAEIDDAIAAVRAGHVVRAVLDHT